jgi:hypothetical protein
VAKNTDFTIDTLFGGKIPSTKVALAGMADLERELDRSFKDQARERALQQRTLAKLHAPILESVQGSEQVAAAVRQLKADDARRGKIKLYAPEVAAVAPRIFAGSIGITFAPPYNYPWTWTAFTGSASDHSAAANRSTGAISFGLHTSNGGDAATSAGRAAVGSYFRPMTANGILRVSATPSFSYNWWTSCAFASAHSDGFIGLYVGRYTLAGGFDGAPVNQQISLWHDNSWWSGASGSASSSGYGLSAQFNVDSSHYYQIWVWCGGYVSASGWHTFSGSGAGAYMSARVPSIHAELF